jgi:hypothetical protein
MKNIAEIKLRAREAIEAKILFTTLVAMREGQDPQCPVVKAKIRSLKLRELNAVTSPFTPEEAQQLFVSL